MTVRAYCPKTVNDWLDKCPVDVKRKRICMEKKNVDRVILNGEPFNLMTMYIEGREIMLDQSECTIEIFQGDPADGLTDGICFEVRKDNKNG